MKKFYIFCLMIPFVSFSLILNAQFSGTALESFDYTSGESLVGQTAPAEFDGVWSTTSTEWDGSAVIATEGLSYPGLTTAGGAVYIQTGTNETRLECNYSDSVCKPGSTLWASMLFNSDTDLDGSGQVWLQPSAATTAPQEESGFGYHWSDQFKAVGDWESFGPAIMGGTTYLLLAKFVVAEDASMEATYWVDPVIDGNEPSADDAFIVMNFAEMFASKNIALWAGYGESGITIDEIRISTNYFEPEPEPFSGTAIESFDYTSGESLIGQTASAEFDGVWSSFSSEWDGSAEIVSDGLTYSGMASTGGAVYIQTGSNETRLECNYTGEVCTPGTTLWASMLFNSDTDLDGSGQVWLQPSAATTAPQEESGFGYHWSDQFKAVGDWESFGPAIMGGTTYLLLAKFVVAADASMEATYWVDPVLDLNNEPSADDAFIVMNFAEMFTSDHIALWAGYGESGITIDEIRISTESYYDPSTSIGNISSNNTSLVAYPNPVENQLNISNEDIISSLSIVNILGQEMVSFDNLQLGTLSIDVSELESGVYFVRAVGNDGQRTIKKIMKQ
ncbi:T9SS type A sorting domain-containing protein [Desulfosarcina sp.]|nr:T9SS type A sorting domain-containing protein [Desulfosarcina sp.]